MSAPASDTILRVDGLTKFFGDVKAVDGLSLEIRRGEVFGFLGPNGAGKTTTIKMMCGLLRPDRGTVEVSGVNPHAAGSRARRRSLELLDTFGLMDKRNKLGRTLTLVSSGASDVLAINRRHIPLVIVCRHIPLIG